MWLVRERVIFHVVSDTLRCCCSMLFTQTITFYEYMKGFVRGFCLTLQQNSYSIVEKTSSSVFLSFECYMCIPILHRIVRMIRMIVCVSVHLHTHSFVTLLILLLLLRD
jgi:hypothetical protein